LAQRAYRLRKENTINELKEQVTALQQTIEDMSKAFLSFNDNAMASGILQVRPELARQLKATTERFISLSRSANKGSDDEHSGSDIDSVDESHAPRRAQSGMMESRSYRIAADNRSSSPELIPRQREVLPLGYVQISDDSSGIITPNLVDTATMDISGMSGVSNDMIAVTSGMVGFDSLLQAAGVPFDKIQPLSSQIFSVDSMELPTAPDPTDLSALHNTSLPNELAPAYTYSFQETRFAKRLHRATLERGFHLLSTAHLRPAAFSHVFRFSLLYNTRDALLARFKYKLSLPPDAPLEYYNTPFIHLGGAGLHYSKRKVSNSYLIKPGPMMPGMRVPKARLESADPATGAQPYDIELDLREYEGEWYDAIDVEGFLEEKGVRIEDIGSFAEAIITEEASAAVSAPSPSSNVFSSPPSLVDGSNSAGASTTAPPSAASPQTPILSETSLQLATARLFPELDGLGQDSVVSMDSEAMGWLMGSGDKTPDFLSSGWANDTQMLAPWNGAADVNPFGDWNLDELPPPDTPPAPPAAASRPAKKTVTIDVNKFINGEFCTLLPCSRLNMY